MQNREELNITLSALDDQILRSVESGVDTFAEIKDDAKLYQLASEHLSINSLGSPAFALIDTRLMVLRQEGKLSFSAGKWKVVGG